MKTLNKKNIPNIISLFRIILVPIIFILIILSFFIEKYFLEFKINDQYDYKIPILFIIAGFLFLVGIISDFLDGYIARKYKLVSDSGKLLDAIADKILVNTVLIAFLYESILPVFVVFLLIIRDFCIDAFRLFLSTKKNQILPASNLGKYKTIFIMIGLMILFIFNTKIILINNQNMTMYYWLNQILLIPIYIGVILSILSAIIYVFSSIKNFKKSNDIKKNGK